MAVPGVVDEGIGPAVALGVGREPLAVEGVGADGAVKSRVPRRTGGRQINQLLPRQRRSVGEANPCNPVFVGAERSLVEFAVQRDPIAAGSVGEDQVAGAIAADDERRSGDPGPELDDGGRIGLVAVVLVDLQMAVASIVDEGIGAAIALRVGCKSLTIKSVGGEGAVEGGVGRGTGGFNRDQLPPRERGSVGEVQRDNAIFIGAPRSPGQLIVEGDLVAGGCVRQDDIAQPVAGDPE